MVKIVRKDGRTFELYKESLAIRRMERLDDGSKVCVETADYDNESVCDYEWGMIEGEEPNVEAPWPTTLRKEAAKRGLNKYYTGRNCKRGHISQRYTSTGLCIACVAMKARKFSNTIKAACKGMESLEDIYAYPEDIPTIKVLVDNMSKARKLYMGKERPL